MISLTTDELVYLQHGAPLRTDGQHPGWGRHEVKLGIDNNWSWKHGSKPSVPPGPNGYPVTFEGVNYTAHNVWGQVIPELGATYNPASKIRVQVGVPVVFHLLNFNDPAQARWVRRHPAGDLTKLSGGYWNGGGGNYTKTVSFAEGKNWRKEAEGHSFDVAPFFDSAGKINQSTSIAHFYWPAFSTRLLMQPKTQVCVINRYRLISDNPATDPATLGLAAAFSGDVFETPTTSTGTVNGFSRNRGFASPRHKRLVPEWRIVGHITGGEENIRRYPPLPPF